MTIFTSGNYRPPLGSGDGGTVDEEQNPLRFVSRNERIILPAGAVNSDLTVQFEVKTTDSEFFALLHDTGSLNFAGQASNDNRTNPTHFGSGSSIEFYADGSLVGGSDLETGPLWDAWATGEWVTARMDHIDTSAWSNANLFWGDPSDATLGKPFSGQIRNIKLDYGSTGTWDVESALGQTDGCDYRNCP